MRANIFLDVPSAEIRDRVPARLQPAIPPRYTLPETVVLVILQPDVAMSTLVARVLKRVPQTAPLVVVAANITTDGVALLEARQATLFIRRDWHWTDESYRAVGGR